MIATILQACGVAVFALGLSLIWLPLGIVAAGVGMVLFGLAIERSN